MYIFIPYKSTHVSFILISLQNYNFLLALLTLVHFTKLLAFNFYNLFNEVNIERDMNYEIHQPYAIYYH